MGLAVNIGKTKYMEVQHHRGMIINEHIMVSNNSYEKVKTYKISVILIDKSKFYSRGI